MISIRQQLQQCLHSTAERSNIADINVTIFNRVDECLDGQNVSLDRMCSILRDIGIVATMRKNGGHLPDDPSMVIWLDAAGNVQRAERSSSTSYRVVDQATGGTRSSSWKDVAALIGGGDCIVIPIAQHSFLKGDDSEGASASTSAGGYAGKTKQVRFRDVWPLIKSLMKAEKRDIFIVIVYSTFISLLGLVVPLSSQAVVNAVALGVFSRQLVVLCVVVLIAMLAIAAMMVLERHVIDFIQRRLFVTTAFDIVNRIPRLREDAIRGMYVPELVNRFFDVITVQKTIGKFLLEGVGAFLILLTGLLVLFLYHPFFLVYDLIFIGFIPILVFVLGRGALTTSLAVSNAKYSTAAWLEEVARNQRSIKLDGDSDYAQNRLDVLNVEYVDAKARHFRIMARQMLGSYIFKAFATVGILALGGVLVLEEAISLGQLVAAEIIIVMIIGAIEKLLVQFDDFYDFTAAIYKLQTIAKLPTEHAVGQQVPAFKDGGSVVLDDVSYTDGSSSVLRNVSLSINAGEHVSIVGGSGSGKSTIAKLIVGLLLPSKGHLRINGVDTKLADLASLRSHVGYLDPDDALVPGSVRDNITLGRPVSQSTIDQVLKLCLLTEEVQRLPRGLQTEVIALGANISYSVRRRILLARVLLGMPDIIIIDSAFQGLEDGLKMRLVESIMNQTSCTVVNISFDTDIISATNRVHVLSQGALVCSGTLDEVCAEREDLRALLLRRQPTRGGSQ
ncbi:MAG: hypothetical protein RIR53_787 [Bacteroidota bacterium]